MATVGFAQYTSWSNGKGLLTADQLKANLLSGGIAGTVAVTAVPIAVAMGATGWWIPLASVGINGIGGAISQGAANWVDPANSANPILAGILNGIPLPLFRGGPRSFAQLPYGFAMNARGSLLKNVTKAVWPSAVFGVWGADTFGPAFERFMANARKRWASSNQPKCLAPRMTSMRQGPITTMRQAPACSSKCY